MKKVLFITEYLNPPFDEGIKKTVLHIFTILNEKYNTLTLSREAFQHKNIQILKANKLFFDKNLLRQINIYNPNVIIYLPFQSGTFASYVRLWFLKKLSRNRKVIFFTLQPKPLSKLKKLIIKFIKPTYGITASPEVKNFWDSIRVNSVMIPLYTSLAEFKPIENEEEKLALRKKYHLPNNIFLVTHIGHLNQKRNLESLIPLCNISYKVLIVGSSSTPIDAVGPSALKQKLIDSGVLIIDGLIENIQEIYQLSDLYIFPVTDNCGSIGLPLSILEARACGLPVITTDYGSVKHFLGDDNNSIYYSIPENFSKTIDKLKLPFRSLSKKVMELNEVFENCLKTFLEAE